MRQQVKRCEINKLLVGMDIRAHYDQSHSVEHMRGQQKASAGHVAACGARQELAPAQSRRFMTFLTEKNIYFGGYARSTLNQL